MTVSPRFFLGRGDLDAVDVDHGGAGVDVLRRGIEGLAGGHRFAAAVVLDEVGDRLHRRHRQALRGVGRHEAAHRAVVRAEVGLRHPVDVVDGGGGDPVTLQEPQPPVAHRRRRGERLGHRGRVGDGVVVAALGAELGPVELLGGEGGVADAVGDRQERRLRLVELPLGRLRHEGEEAGIVGVVGAGARARGDARLDEALLEAADLVLREDAREHREGGPVGVGRGGDVVGGHHGPHLPHAPQDHHPLAVLGRLLGVGRGEAARGARDRAEILPGELQGPRLLELAGHDEDDVVGLVETLVEVAQVVDRHALDVGAVADRRLAVVVPLVGRRLHALREDALGAVLAALELVAHHGELGEQILAAHEAVDEPVALQMDGELEVLVGGGERLEVVGAVDVGGAVEAGPMVAQRLRHLRERRRPLEDQVLEEVGHARLAVALVPRADEDRHVDGDRGAGGIGKEHQPGAVGEAVLAHPLDGGDLLRRCGGGGHGGCHGGEQEGKHEAGTGHRRTPRGIGEGKGGRIIRRRRAGGRRRRRSRRPRGRGAPAWCGSPSGRSRASPWGRR